MQFVKAVISCVLYEILFGNMSKVSYEIRNAAEHCWMLIFVVGPRVYFRVAAYVPWVHNVCVIGS
jgi:hypothetical protein